ncbi:MAG: LCP family protein [Lachnospiraceae bacterium]|nr:LCP family protein [Lachnospiraceae bacterium]
MTEHTPKTNEMDNKEIRKKKKGAGVITLVVLLCMLAVLSVAAVIVWNHTKPDPMSGQKPDFDRTWEETDTADVPGEEGTVEEETVDDDAPTVNESIMDETLPTVEEIRIPKDAGWTHYLLLGIDGSSYKSGHSDAMLVFSIHKENRELVLSSIPRDTLVYVDGKGFDKLTHAYNYGGAELTAKVFADNFDIDIEHYFVVNFQSLPKIVDQIGGVVLTLTDAEAKHMGDQYAAWGLSGGTQRLNGKEVLAYCRVRKIDSDYRRIERQYKALMAIYDEVRTLSYDKYIGLAKVAYESMYSDMKLGDMLLLVKDVMDLAKETKIRNIKIVDGDNSGTAGLRIAADGKSRSYVVVDDLEEVAIRWRQYLGIEGYEPSARVQQIGVQLDRIVGR